MEIILICSFFLGAALLLIAVFTYKKLRSEFPKETNSIKIEVGNTDVVKKTKRKVIKLISTAFG